MAGISWNIVSFIIELMDHLLCGGYCAHKQVASVAFSVGCEIVIGGIWYYVFGTPTVDFALFALCALMEFCG